MAFQDETAPEGAEPVAPYWKTETLAFAEAARKATARVQIERRDNEDASKYAQRLADLAEKFSGFGDKEAEGIVASKRAIADRDLSDMGYSALELVRDYWASRPDSTHMGKSTGRPIAAHTADRYVRTFRRFVASNSQSVCPTRLPDLP